MALKNVLDQVETAAQTELSEVQKMRRHVMSSPHIKTVVLGSVSSPNRIPARYDPVEKIFYPVFKEEV